MAVSTHDIIPYQYRALYKCANVATSGACTYNSFKKRNAMLSGMVPLRSLLRRCLARQHRGEHFVSILLYILLDDSVKIV